MNEKTLKVAVVVALILGGTSGTLVTMNASQVQYSTLMSDFQALTGDFTGLQTDYGGLLNDYGNLTESYGILAGEFDSLNQSYYALLEDYNALSVEFDDLNQTYYTLVADYDTLQALYDSLTDTYTQLMTDFMELGNDYNALLEQYDTLTTWIGQQILPVQYMIFAEAVRRYYFEDFYVKNTLNEGNESGYWTEFTRFCRDVILHDSSSVYQDVIYTQDEVLGQPDIWFGDVSNALSDVLTPYGDYGNDTCVLAARSLAHLLDDNGLYYYGWDGLTLTGNWLTDIWVIVQNCMGVIDYEYDWTLDRDRTPYDWDYIKFPVETAFRTMGDCEDQAMLTAAYLESCGFETAMLVVHDAGNLDYQPAGFYHGALFVKLDNQGEFRSAFPNAMVWNMAWWDSTWAEGGVLIDTTWDVPFGTDPAWLQYYLDTYFYWEDLTPIWTIGFCDIDGLVTYPSTGTGTGLGAFMP